MSGFRLRQFVFAAALVLAWARPLHAQTIGYAEAVGLLGHNCGTDIDKFCKNTNLGGGRVQQCLDQNQAAVSPQCRASAHNLSILLKKRAAARATVARICDGDRLRFCGGIQPGDANLMECFEKAKRNVSAKCRQAVADAGYEASLATGPITDQIHLSSADIVSSLHGVEASSPRINAASLRQQAAQAVANPSRVSRVNRAPLSEELSNHAQLTIAIQFDFDSARIRPNSFRAIGLMADALYSPYLQDYCFLVVGHTDAKGSREYNLKLSQQRADAIREALIDPFGIKPGRIEAVGLGEEQLLSPGSPEAAENRRVQLINIGQFGANGQCSK